MLIFSLFQLNIIPDCLSQYKTFNRNLLQFSVYLPCFVFDISRLKDHSAPVFKSPNLHMSNPCQDSYLFSAVNSPQMPPGLRSSAVKTHCYSGISKLTRDSRCSLKNTRKILLTSLINWQFKMALFSVSILTVLTLISHGAFASLEIFFLSK